jgi:hypothetical protein
MIQIQTIEIEEDPALVSLRNNLKECAHDPSEALPAFLALLAHTLEPLLHEPMDHALQAQARNVVVTCFAAAHLYGAHLLAFDGLILVGADADFNLDQYCIDLCWKTQFFPGPRYEHHNKTDRPLGFYKNYDLYCSTHEPINLIARYGNRVQDFLDPTDPSADACDALVVAFDRARTLAYIKASHA